MVLNDPCIRYRDTTINCAALVIGERMQSAIVVWQGNIRGVLP